MLGLLLLRSWCLLPWCCSFDFLRSLRNPLAKETWWTTVLTTLWSSSFAQLSECVPADLGSISGPYPKTQGLWRAPFGLRDSWHRMEVLGRQQTGWWQSGGAKGCSLENCPSRVLCSGASLNQPCWSLFLAAAALGGCTPMHRPWTMHLLIYSIRNWTQGLLCAKRALCSLSCSSKSWTVLLKLFSQGHLSLNEIFLLLLFWDRVSL